VAFLLAPEGGDYLPKIREVQKMEEMSAHEDMIARTMTAVMQAKAAHMSRNLQ